jgi:hypothetical protein
MTAPIHMDDLGPFVANLRSEGFDARTDLFNGQVGLIVGPGGLDPKRMPPNTAGLFFPLWELNYAPNRPLVKARKFHDIFESRPTDWQFNHPYQNPTDHERINLRHWNRSASLLGAGKLEETIQQELIRRFPPSDFPVNIDVVGGQAQTYATVRVTNFEAGIDETEKAMPEDFIGSGGTPAAVLDAAERIISELNRTGRLPAVPKRPSPHPGLKVTLRAIGHVGEGPDVRHWPEVYQYEVQGLPSGERAWIANFGAPNRKNWRILRATNEVQSDWTGDYESVEEALTVIQQEFAEG